MSHTDVPFVFIDTNVWFSAFYGSANSETLIKAHANGQIKAVISQQVLNELIKNISAKVPGALPPLKRFFEATPPVIVADPIFIQPDINKSVQRKDAAIFAACVRAGTKLFITGNAKDFDIAILKLKFGVAVYSPAQAVKILRL